MLKNIHIQDLHIQERLRLSLFILLFVITIGISNMFKTSINEVDRVALDTQIKGIGKIKANKIVGEREINGNYKDKEDFENRTKEFLGEIVTNRIEKTYKIK